MSCLILQHPGGEVNYMMTRLYPGHEVPQFWELASKNKRTLEWTKDPETENKLPKTIKMTLVRPPMTNLKMTVRADCAISPCSPFLLSIKTLAPLVASVERVGLWTDTHTPLHPHPQLLASEIKQTFLSSNLAYLLASEQQAVGPLLCQ